MFSQLSKKDYINFLKYHIIQGRITEADLVANGCMEFTTLAGFKISVTASTNGDIMINNGGSRVLESNVGVSDDGVFHGIDRFISDAEFVPCPTS